MTRGLICAFARAVAAEEQATLLAEVTSLGRRTFVVRLRIAEDSATQYSG